MASVPLHHSVPASPDPGLPHEYTTDDDDGGERRSVARSASARRLNSCESTLNNGGGSVRRRGDCGSGGEKAAGDNTNARIKRCQTAPGYMSFEDVISGEALFGREGRGAWRQPEEAASMISDSLVRTASRLYLRETADHHRRSLGPLGTHRGSAMHRLVKKYLNPCLGFLASTIFCGSAASVTCPISS